MNQHEFTMQHDKTIQIIETNIKKVKASISDYEKHNRMFKTIGILSFAKELEIITSDEYEHYFNRLFQ